MVGLLIGIHVFTCIALIFIVLLQPGNKQGMGAALGGGGAQTVFGGASANTFLSKLTAAAAVIFMLTSLTLVWVSSRSGSVTDAFATSPKADEAKADDNNNADPAALPASAPAADSAENANQEQPAAVQEPADPVPAAAEEAAKPAAEAQPAVAEPVAEPAAEPAQQ